MSIRNVRNEIRSDSSEYMKGYQDGMNQAFQESELDAYYAGVGYGKKYAGDKHIGFNNDAERRQFEKGMSEKDKHFRAYQAEPISFWERLFGFGSSTYDSFHTRENRRDRVVKAKLEKKRKDRKQKRTKKIKAVKHNVRKKRLKPAEKLRASEQK